MVVRRKFVRRRPMGAGRKRAPFQRKKIMRKRRVNRAMGISRFERIGFPQTKIVKMRYTQAFSLASSAGSVAGQSFYANRVYRPSGLAHDAIGWDLWKTLYNSYVVIGSKMTVRICGNSYSGSVTVPLWINTALQDDISFSYDFETLSEQGGCKNKLWCPGSANNSYLVQTYSPKKFFNIAQVKDNIDNLGATFVGSPPTGPTRVAYFHVQQQPVDKTANSTNWYVVTIDYIVLMSEPSELSKSTS